MRRAAGLILAHLLLWPAAALAQSVVTRGERLDVDVSPSGGELVFNLLGDLWTVGETGGVASRLAELDPPAARPRWSPDGRRIVYEAAEPDAAAVWLHDVESGEQRRLSAGAGAVWHPSGKRITYASRRNGTDYDLWEHDLGTGLEWRLSSGPADEQEPAWSSDGRNLVYVRHDGTEWALVLRRFAEPDAVLATSPTPLGAPSWRPDGTLISFFREHGAGYELRMIILSDPPLERIMGDEPGLYPSPVAWTDRSRFVYSAGDRLKSRHFDDRNGRSLAFRASLGRPATTPVFSVAERSLPLISPAADKLVVRAGRLFDGYSSDYRYAVDVLLDGGEIAEVTALRDWDDVPVIELPATTLLPGFIDAYTRLPQSDLMERGPQLLSWGVTTLVAKIPGDFDAGVWEQEATPGPRLLPAAALSPEVPANGIDEPGAPHLVVAEAASPGGDAGATASRAWQALGIPVLGATWSQSKRLDAYLMAAGETIGGAATGNLGGGRFGFRRKVVDLSQRQLVSGLAHRQTRGLAELYEARQAQGLRRPIFRQERVPLLDDLRRTRTPIVVASAMNGLLPGLALHAELLALEEGGLAGAQILKAAGRHAAAVLGVAGQIGEISVGARADLVLVNGDPIARPADARNVVAVVRNGRFYSLASLLEMSARSVE